MPFNTRQIGRVAARRYAVVPTLFQITLTSSLNKSHHALPGLLMLLHSASFLPDILGSHHSCFLSCHECNKDAKKNQKNPDNNKQKHLFLFVCSRDALMGYTRDLKGLIGAPSLFSVAAVHVCSINSSISSLGIPIFKIIVSAFGMIMQAKPI